MRTFGDGRKPEWEPPFPLMLFFGVLWALAVLNIANQVAHSYGVDLFR